MLKWSMVLCLLALPAYAADVGVPANNLISASSGNVAAATATATMPAVQGFLNRLCEFQVTSAGSTGAAVVNLTVTGLAGGTLTYSYTSVAGATLGNLPLVVQFTPCQPASAVNVAIVVSLPSLGAGNTNASVNLQGYLLSP